jgi:anti-sigma factor (TIGR02949 family)
MNCSQVKQNIPQWLDGELAADEAAVIATHVDHCPACGHEAVFWQRVSSVLNAEAGAVKAPPGFSKKVMAQLNGRQQSGLSSMLTGWKRNLAAAAAFLLIAAGSAGAYMHMGSGNSPNQVAAVKSKQPARLVVTQPPHVNSNHTADVNNPKAGPKTINNNDSKASGSGATDQPVDVQNHTQDNQVPVKTTITTNPGPQQAKSTAQPAAAVQAPQSQPKVTQPGATNTLTAPQTNQGDDYVLLSTGQDRFAANTLIRVKVTNMDAAYKQAMTLINSSGSEYEVLASETAPGNSQETLKVTVDSAQSGSLKGSFSQLGQVVTTDTQKEDLNSKYNEKVGEYRSLEAQLQTAGTADARNQLQTQMDGIKAQLKAWDNAANTATIILWLEN